MNKPGTVRFVILGTYLVGYITARNFVSGLEMGAINRELTITLFRCLTIGLAFLLFKDLILKKRFPKHRITLKPLIALPAAVWMLNPILFGTWGAQLDAPAKLVFALTTITVGLNEEIVWRGIIQNATEKKLGAFRAIITTNMLFMIMHFGFTTYELGNLLGIFLAGCLLSVVYHRTGNLAFCVLLHTLYDVLYVVTPVAGLYDPMGMRTVSVTILALMMLGRMDIVDMKFTYDTP